MNTPTKEQVLERVENMFSYHPPTEEQKIKYEHLRSSFKNLALHIADITPICPDQTIALRKLHDASMAVNLVIACNEE